MYCNTSMSDKAFQNNFLEVYSNDITLNPYANYEIDFEGLNIPSEDIDNIEQVVVDPLDGKNEELSGPFRYK